MKHSSVHLLVVFFFLAGSAVQAQPSPIKPGGGADTMEDYAENLKNDYNVNTFRPALEPQEPTSLKVIEELRKFNSSPTDVDPENLYEYNMGTTEQEVSDNWKADLYELAGNYEYQDENFCSATRQVGECIYGPPYHSFIFSVPMWEYFVPFQRVEATNVPFLTGYWPQEDVIASLNLFKPPTLMTVTYKQLDSDTMQDRVLDGKSPVMFPGMKTMKEESDDALYDGFMPMELKSIIMPIMAAAGDDERMEWKERLPKNWEKVVTKYLDEINPDNTATGYDPDGTIGNPTGNPGDGGVDEKVLDHFKDKFDLEISRWRDGKHSTDGQMRMEYHFSTTFFHDTMKYFPEFNKFAAIFLLGPGGVGTANEPITWCHAGAVFAFLYTPRPGLEQLYFGEWVYHGLFARTYAMLSFLWDELAEFTPDPTQTYTAPNHPNTPAGQPALTVPELLNCMQKNFAAAGGDTPDDMRYQLAGEVIPQYCFAKNHTDTIGPITNQHKTHYPALASEQAFRRGLLGAREFPVTDIRTHNTRDRNGTFPRDKYMIFNTEYDGGDPEVDWVRLMFAGDEPQSEHNKEFARGCIPWDKTNQAEFTADWGGAGYGAANHFNLDYHGHRHVRAHFRYIRCCPAIPVDIIFWEPPADFQLW